MFDRKGSDSGHEWIEIVNDGTSTIDISSYKLFEGETNHKLGFVQGSAMLSINGIAVIADNPTKFLEDWPNYSGTLIDSAFSGGLSNTGEAISIKNASGKVEDKAIYTSSKGAGGNGLSLSRGLTGSFVATKPSPGVFDATPTKATVSAPSKPVTTKAPKPFKSKAHTILQSQSNTLEPQDSIAAVEPAVSALVSRGTTTSNTLLYILAAGALAVLGAGCVFALKYARETAIPQEDRELKKLVDSFEIIE